MRGSSCVSGVYNSHELWWNNDVYDVCLVQNTERRTSRYWEMDWLFWARYVMILRDQIKVIRLHWHLFSIQGLKFPGFPSLSEEPGKIYVLDLLHPKPTPVELQIRGNLDLDSFNPHGISVYSDDAGDPQIMEYSIIFHSVFLFFICTVLF